MPVFSHAEPHALLPRTGVGRARVKILDFVRGLPKRLRILSERLDKAGSGTAQWGTYPSAPAP